MKTAAAPSPALKALRATAIAEARARVAQLDAAAATAAENAGRARRRATAAQLVADRAKENLRALLAAAAND